MSDLKTALRNGIKVEWLQPGEIAYKYYGFTEVAWPWYLLDIPEDVRTDILIVRGEILMPLTNGAFLCEDEKTGILITKYPSQLRRLHE